MLFLGTGTHCCSQPLPRWARWVGALARGLTHPARARAGSSVILGHLLPIARVAGQGGGPHSYPLPFGPEQECWAPGTRVWAGGGQTQGPQATWALVCARSRAATAVPSAPPSGLPAASCAERYQDGGLQRRGRAWLWAGPLRPRPLLGADAPTSAQNSCSPALGGLGPGGEGAEAGAPSPASSAPLRPCPARSRPRDGAEGHRAAQGRPGDGGADAGGGGGLQGGCDPGPPSLPAPDRRPQGRVGVPGPRPQADGNPLQEPVPVKTMTISSKRVSPGEVGGAVWGLLPWGWAGV